MTGIENSGLKFWWKNAWLYDVAIDDEEYTRELDTDTAVVRARKKKQLEPWTKNASIS